MTKVVATIVFEVDTDINPVFAKQLDTCIRTDVLLDSLGNYAYGIVKTLGVDIVAYSVEEAK